MSEPKGSYGQGNPVRFRRGGFHREHPLGGWSGIHAASRYPQRGGLVLCPGVRRPVAERLQADDPHFLRLGKTDTYRCPIRPRKRPLARPEAGVIGFLGREGRAEIVGNGMRIGEPRMDTNGHKFF